MSTATRELQMSEEQLQAATMQLAELRKWKAVHFRPAMTSQGWRTPVQGDGKGWPDFFAVRGERCVVMEFKSERGRLTKEQDAWLLALEQIEGIEQYLIRPSDWTSGAVDAILR